MTTPMTSDVPPLRPLPPRLAALHARVRRQPWLRRFTLANRLLLCMAFLPTGLVKLLGERFTQLGTENPVGFFFEALYRTGPYWRFIGGVQVVAALCLLVPRTALLGALLFAPVSVSILLITAGIGFGNTVWIAAGMLLSVTYLICWDGDRVWSAAAPILAPVRGARLLEGMHRVECLGWCLGGAAGLGLFLVTRGLVAREATPGLLGAGALGALLVLLGWILGFRGRAQSNRGG